MRQRVTDLIPNFAGGLNSVAEAVALAENQVSAAVNARLTQFGAITKRKGTQRMHSSALHSSGIQGVYEWAMSDGTRYLIAVANGTLYWSTYGSFPMTFTSVAGSLASTGKVCMVAFKDGSGDALYIADGGQLNKLTVAAGPTFTLSTDLASTPGVRVIDVFNQRLWSCGCGNEPQSIFYSALNNGDSLGVGVSSGGQIVVRTFGQQNVVSVKALGTSLLIHHRGGVSRLTGFGQDDTIVAPSGVSGEVGTIAPSSVVRIGNVVYYVNVRGLFIGTADGVAPVSTPEKPDPLAPLLPLLTETQVSNISCVLSRATNEILIHVPTLGTYTYQTILQSWSGPWNGTFSSTGYQPFAECGNADNEPVVVKGDAAGFIELIDTGQRDSVTAAGSGGDTVPWLVTCRRLFFGDFASVTSLRWAYVLADLDGADGSSLSWQTDQGGGSRPMTQDAIELLGLESSGELSTETGITMAVSTTVQSLRIPAWGTGYYVDLTIQDTSDLAIPSVSRVELSGFRLGRR